MSPNEIRHPSSEAEFNDLYDLLQSSLREDSSIPISAEYPLALDQAHPERSFCAFEGPKIVSHINLLPRTVQHTNAHFRIGLVGNVATAAPFRGQGISQNLMKQVEETAREMGLQALILWNDIPEFYSKLGFRTFGTEKRSTFKDIDALRLTSKVALEIGSASNIDAQMIKIFETLRSDGSFTLERSLKEWKSLLSIPQTHLIIEKENDSIQSFFIIGRGSDMRHVIHEWGTQSEDALIAAVHLARKITGFEEVMVLAPNWVDENLLIRGTIEQTSMCWIKELKPLPKSFEQRFYVWGLDSI